MQWRFFDATVDCVSSVARQRLSNQCNAASIRIADIDGCSSDQEELDGLWIATKRGLRAHEGMN